MIIFNLVICKTKNQLPVFLIQKGTDFNITQLQKDTHNRKWTQCLKFGQTKPLTSFLNVNHAYRLDVVQS